MDTAAIERRGYDPIRADLARVDKISNHKELVDAILRMHASGMGGVLGFGAGADAKDSRRVIFQVSQGGIGMPDRDYYTKTDSATLAIKTAYQSNIANMLELVGVSAPDAKAQSEQVLALETRLPARRWAESRCAIRKIATTCSLLPTPISSRPAFPGPRTSAPSASKRIRSTLHSRSSFARWRAS
jgi:predicted metalloendopeptidase